MQCIVGLMMVSRHNLHRKMMQLVRSCCRRQNLLWLNDNLVSVVVAIGTSCTLIFTLFACFEFFLYNLLSLWAKYWYGHAAIQLIVERRTILGDFIKKNIS